MIKPTKKQLTYFVALALVVIGIVSNVGGAYTTLKDILSAGYGFQVSVLWGLILIPIVATPIYLFVKRAGPHPSEISSVENAGQYFELIQSQIAKSNAEIIAFGLGKEWVFPLVVSIAMARARGCLVNVAYFDEFHERYRLLALLGCTVKRLPSERERERFVGCVSDGDNILNCSATARVARQRETTYARHYFSALDFWLISAARKYLINRLEEVGSDANSGSHPEFKPKFVEVSDSSILEKLRNVRFYKSANIILEEIRIKETIPVSAFVSRYKINQVRDLIRLYREKGWALFRPVGISLANGMISPLIPPVIEIHNDRMYVAEGHTRLHTLRQEGIETALVAVVRGVDTELPMKPCSWRKVVVVDDKKEKGDPKLARYIETGTHQGIWSDRGESAT